MIEYYKLKNNIDSIYHYINLYSSNLRVKQSDGNQYQSILINRKLEKEMKIDAIKKEMEKRRLINIGFIILSIIFILFIGVVTKLYFKIKKEKEDKDILYKELNHKNTEINDSINYSKGIQESILPIIEDENVFTLFKPKDIVSGDFYWTGEKNGRKLYVTADCTGHGVPGALLSMLCSQLLTEGLSKYNDLKSIIDYVSISIDNKMSEIGRRDSLELSIISIKDNNVEFYGIKRPLFFVREGNIEVFKPENDVITFDMKKNNDLLYMTSDGYIDQFGGEAGKKFGSKRFREYLLELSKIEFKYQKDL
ncbi:MAG: hypothetical protein K0B10_01275 [Vicingaceae bacterium]|nr:hypothetical protein [Vicingaceae bacterium]